MSFVLKNFRNFVMVTYVIHMLTLEEKIFNSIVFVWILNNFPQINLTKKP